jgi:hypothetical protein
MELLIPGLILVALMVYASTKIKKRAAQAFERESIETDNFSLIKPEGFVHVLNGDPKFAFEAYSKELGKESSENVRQVTVKLQVFGNAELSEVVADTKNSLSEPIAEGEYVSGLRQVDNAIFEVCHKIIPKNGNVFDLEVAVLHDHADDLKAEVHELLQSFQTR